MRTLLRFVLVLLFASTIAAATLDVEVRRQGFTGPIRIDVASRIDGRLPEWSATKTLLASQSRASFPGLAEGLYVVLASGPQPLQRLSAKANVGGDGGTVRMSIPKSKTSLRATLAGEPIPRAGIALTHDELRWSTDVETGEDGRFAGDLWEPGAYTASVSRDRTSAPHRADVRLSTSPLTIDVPDRHVRGRVVGADGMALAGATLTLRSEISESMLSMRTMSAPDGHFEFFGVREGAQTLLARAPSYVDSDAVRFELHGPSAVRTLEMQLTRGEPHLVRVVDPNDHPIAGATLITSCNGDVKSTSVTSAEGGAEVALPSVASCAVYVLPKEGSLAIRRFESDDPMLIRMPKGNSSLRLALKTDAGVPFSDIRLLMRIDGEVIPPEIARLLGGRGFPLLTNAEGTITLQHIPAGMYEFWPYRSASEGQLLYETASDFDAPISVNVLAGENNATIRFQAR